MLLIIIFITHNQGCELLKTKFEESKFPTGVVHIISKDLVEYNIELQIATNKTHKEGTDLQQLIVDVISSIKEIRGHKNSVV